MHCECVSNDFFRQTFSRPSTLPQCNRYNPICTCPAGQLSCKRLRIDLTEAADWEAPNPQIRVRQQARCHPHLLAKEAWAADCSLDRGRKRDPHHRRAQPCAAESFKAGGARLLRGHNRIFGWCSCSLAVPMLRDASRQAIDIAWHTATSASQSEDCARIKVWRRYSLSRLAKAARHIQQTQKGAGRNFVSRRKNMRCWNVITICESHAGTLGLAAFALPSSQCRWSHCPTLLVDIRLSSRVEHPQICFFQQFQLFLPQIEPA